MRDPIELVFLLTVMGVWLTLARVSRPFALAVAGFLLLTGALARSGLLTDFAATPPRIFWVIAPASLATLALAFSPLGTRLLERASLAGLIAFQVFRLPVELVLWQLHRDGVVPVQMTFEGQNFDILVGASAPFVAGLGALGTLKPRALALWNGLGLALLANTAAVAVLSMPTPLRVFANEPANTFAATQPWIWLPAFLVPAALGGHLLLFRKLAALR